ncbi:SpoIIE family protein phosphatase [Treponema sp.]|uniref:SpoIIE family protein phosphatase n=1 Tax=Treponema sp. TaxID=166 RepID=UPI00298DFEBC|nr:SpoIIE family protein phosphatase [Treponema sp.]MCR5613127.1 SpoIIE family protein phosphatase [Treponema sp.]
MDKIRNFNKVGFLFILCALFSAVSGFELCAQDYYWENPEKISVNDSRFPIAVSNSNSCAVFWQEVDEKKSEVYISAAINMADSAGNDYGWKTKRRFAGPFSYAGAVPDLYSAAINNAGRICVTVLAESNMLSVFTSSDGGENFIRTDFARTELPVVAPRVYALKSGDFILFTSLGKNESFSMLYANSHDGIKWSSFSPFEPAKNLTNPFLPVLISSEKGELLLFQAQFNSGTRLSYQLYSTHSRSNGTSWSGAELVTDQSSIPSSAEVYTSYHNQRPTLLSKDGKIYVAWERTHYSSENAHVVFSEIDFASGKLCAPVENITSEGNAGRPVLFSYKNLISLVWFDTRQGAETVYFSQKKGVLWDETKLSAAGRSSVFASPIISNNGTKIAFVWQTNNSVYRLASDASVRSPQIIPLTYKAGVHSKNQKVRYQIVLPDDSSGIAGYSWSWSKDKDELPPETLMALPKERYVEVNADEEAEYYFKVAAHDYAGNWSKPAVISYYLDLTPPPSPVINLPKLDEYGFVDSNSFSLNWLCQSEDTKNTEDISGYSWTIVRAENLDKKYYSSKKHPLKLDKSAVNSGVEALNKKYSPEKISSLAQSPSKKVMQKKNDTHFINYANGVYIFSVRAIDEVGNVSEPSYVALYLNKFEPATFINSVKKSSDIFGNTTLSVLGGGFTYDGIISDIYIYKENKKESVLTLRYANGEFKIDSDERISNIHLSNEMPEGRYYIALKHTDRGIYRSDIAFTISENGTVKIEHQYEYVPDWNVYARIGKYSVQVAYILLAFLMLLALAGIFVSVRGIISTVRDFNIINLEVQALVKGDIMPLQKKQRVASLKSKGGGLRLKLIMFTVVLVLMVSLLVSIPLGFIMVKTQEQSLSQGLEDRVNVLLESLSSGTKAYMPTENVLELSYLPGQSSALEEANFVTITGFKTGEDDSVNATLDYAWATNDEHISSSEKSVELIIDTETFTPGVSRITDEHIVEIAKECAKINDEAIKTAGEIGNNIARLNSEGASLALKTDRQSVERRNEIADITTQLTTRMTETLNELSIKNISSYPLYDSGKLNRDNTEYLFYRPVLYRSGSSSNYVRAIVFISISTKKLIAEIDSAQKIISFTALGIGLLAVIIGTIFAIMLASIIVNPIRRLAKHVQMIGETRDKEKLAGKEIVIKSHDEIGQLGETVNEMTRGLVKAAQDEHLLMDGKVVQQTFLPLGSDDKGNKQTTAQLKDGKLEFYGYYEGASGVSGDYFDYKKLDDRFYIIIKCDVSGHGVPAALLMTVVATLFRKYFENWSFKKNGTDLQSLVCTINDFIEGLGIKGKFATIILALVDTQTGDVYLCNAGDNIVHIYDSTEHKQKVLTLTETPAAGPLPTFMVEMKGGFKLEKTHLNKGDVLFLYTDGIEEATRKFRDSDFNVTKCAEPGLKEGDVHKNHKVGQDSEQMEPERVSAIIEAALNRRTYVLEKYHSPVPGEKLEFDFSKCDGSIEDAIMALASVEKVFRFYKAPDVTANDIVRVDKKIDAYLSKCFNRYDYYCSNKQAPDAESSYLYYTNLQEDEQLDDLTLVAVRL